MNQHSQDKQDTWLRLVNFTGMRDAAAIADDEEVLRQAGFDLQAESRAARSVARNALQACMKQQALSEQMTHTRDAAVSGTVLAWSAEKIQRWLDCAARGVFGERVQHLAKPCYRNKQQGGMSEQEMRTLLMDISRTVGGLPDRE